MADSPADRTTPAEVAAAILMKPPPGCTRMKTKLGIMPTTRTTLFADEKKPYEKPALRVITAVFLALSAKELSDSAMVQKVNVSVSVGSMVPALGSDEMRVYDVATDLGAKNVIKLISPAFVSPSGIELDLDVYVNNPASCQPTKKALCGDQMSLVTAAWSTPTSISPA